MPLAFGGGRRTSLFIIYHPFAYLVTLIGRSLSSSIYPHHHQSLSSATASTFSPPSFCNLQSYHRFAEGGAAAKSFVTRKTSTSRRMMTTGTGSSLSHHPQPKEGGNGEVPSLDRSSFTEYRTIQALKIPASKCNEVLKQISPYLFRSRRIRSVITPEEFQKQQQRKRDQEASSIARLQEGQRLILLSNDAGEKREMGEEEGESIGKEEILQKILKDIEGAEKMEHVVEIGYDDLTVEQVLKRILPSTMDIPSAFETVGHLAHLNLRFEALPYKHLIAQVLLDKNPRIRTVINKLASIENQFRVFPLEILAGEPSTEISLKESGANFQFDFAQVYWNSRLQGEHDRLIQWIHQDALLKHEQKQEEGGGVVSPPPVVVWDVFAGVGPFSIPLAIKAREGAGGKGKEGIATSKSKEGEGSEGTGGGGGGGGRRRGGGKRDRRGKVKETGERIMKIYANDLNDRSHHYLCQNAQRNKVNDPQIFEAFNLDGRAFVQHLASLQTSCTHIIMNLPATAIEFLDVIGQGRLSYLPHPPMLHVYCFSKADNPEEDVIQRACLALDVPTLPQVQTHQVRDVAPKKIMLCLSFPLPPKAYQRS